jgi:two-component system response regulator YesN
MPQEEFEHNVELLDVLAEHFLASETALVSRLLPKGEGLPRQTAKPAVLTGQQARERADHPRVREALDLADRHLSDPNMTVAGIARALNINPTYLAHLFVERVGIRMSRYISEHRIVLAKKLLRTTNWQIKRVAYESGHANADWFSQVFRAHTGMTPREFRRRAALR